LDLAAHLSRPDVPITGPALYLCFLCLGPSFPLFWLWSQLYSARWLLQSPEENHLETDPNLPYTQILVFVMKITQVLFWLCDPCKLTRSDFLFGFIFPLSYQIIRILTYFNYVFNNMLYSFPGPFNVKPSLTAHSGVQVASGEIVTLICDIRFYYDILILCRDAGASFP
jgi:hypothetical protein